MSEQTRTFAEAIASAAPEITKELTKELTIPVPESFLIDDKNYERFYSYIQNWGQALQSWGFGYNFIDVVLPNLGNISQPSSGNTDLDNALVNLANVISQNNQENKDNENLQWRMRAVGGKYNSFHELLIDWKLETVGLMDTHCWLPVIGDNNLEFSTFDPWCLELFYSVANRSNNTAKACYIKLPSNQDVAILDLPNDYPSELMTAGAKIAVVSPGSSMLEFSEGLADKGYYMCVPTAPGILSVGGVVAISGHGSGVPSASSDSLNIPDYAFSTVSNQLVWMDIIAYNGSQYELKRLSRDDSTTSEDFSAMACSLGKCFSLRMAFLVYPLQKGNRNARILQLNHFIEAKILLGADGTAPGSLQYLAQNYGGFEPIQFPTYNENFYEGKDFVWTKTWSYHPDNDDFTDVKVFHKDPNTGNTVASNLQQSWYSQVNQPFNYPATAGISCPTSAAIVHGVKILPGTTPALTTVGALHTGNENTTGGGYFGTPVDNGKTGFWSDNNLNVYYFVEPDTVRAYDWSYGVLCPIDQIQAVVNTFYTVSLQLLQEFHDKGDYPVMTAGEIRLVGLDLPPAEEWSYPALSTASPGLLPPGAPATNMVCVYLSWLSSAVQPTYWDFCSQLEDLLFFGNNPALGEYSWAVEWSKAWGCTEEGPYKSDAKLARVRSNFNQGANTDGFTKVAQILQAADPDNLFYSRMLNRLFEI